MEKVVQRWKEWWKENSGKTSEGVWRSAMAVRGSGLRGRAAELLVRSGFEVDAAALEALSLDKHAENRILAAAALFRTGEVGKAVDVMLDEVRSEDWSARRRTIQTAATLAHPGAFPVLIAALDDPERSLRKMAWSGLSRLVDEPLAFDPQAFDAKTIEIRGKSYPASSVVGRFAWKGDHRPEGIILMAGAGVRPGGIISRADLLDVAPTILALLGLPPSIEMPGNPLWEAMERDDLTPPQDARHVSYDYTYSARADSKLPSKSIQEKMKDQLEAIGYIK